MKKFMDEDFLLGNETARKLYHDHAAKMPVFDYHCHVSPRDIALDEKLGTITNAWLGDDHYKWRLMRSCGVEEQYITGDADDLEKFKKFAETLPLTIGNPVYQWTHLELRRFFECDLILNPENALRIWDHCNEYLLRDDMSVRSIIRKSNVTHICTTDDPIDSLEWHKLMKEDHTWGVKVLPTFRPDKAINIDKPGFIEYIATLSEVAGTPIKTIDDLCDALVSRIEYFKSLGCVISDHGLDYITWAEDCEDVAGTILGDVLDGKKPTLCEAEAFKAAMMLFLAREYTKRGWTMQIHYGAARNVNSSMFKSLGPDTGFDSISGRECSSAMYCLLDAMNREGNLPKTILYSLNPNDDAYLATAIGAFQSSQLPAKIQHGSAWWFNDTKIGMISQMTNLANVGVLGNFIGMLTDSRSFLSYTRHEYFRRILSNLIGDWVENGEYPNDMEFLGSMVRDISYNNAIRYLGV